MCGLCPTFVIGISGGKNPTKNPLVLPLLSSTSKIPPYHYRQFLKASNYILPSMLCVPTWEGKCTYLGLKQFDKKLNEEALACLKLAVWNQPPQPQRPWLPGRKHKGVVSVLLSPQRIIRGAEVHFYTATTEAQNHAFLVPVTFLSWCNSFKWQ